MVPVESVDFELSDLVVHVKSIGHQLYPLRHTPTTHNWPNLLNFFPNKRDSFFR